MEFMEFGLALKASSFSFTLVICGISLTTPAILSMTWGTLPMSIKLSGIGGRMEKAVFVLGAGGSAPFGVPTLIKVFQDYAARSHLRQDLFLLGDVVEKMHFSLPGIFQKAT